MLVSASQQLPSCLHHASRSTTTAVSFLACGGGGGVGCVCVGCVCGVGGGGGAIMTDSPGPWSCQEGGRRVCLVAPAASHTLASRCRQPHAQGLPPASHGGTLVPSLTCWPNATCSAGFLSSKRPSAPSAAPVAVHTSDSASASASPQVAAASACERAGQAGAGGDDVKHGWARVQAAKPGRQAGRRGSRGLAAGGSAHFPLQPPHLAQPSRVGRSKIRHWPKDRGNGGER